MGIMEMINDFFFCFSVPNITKKGEKSLPIMNILTERERTSNSSWKWYSPNENSNSQKVLWIKQTSLS